MAFQYTEALIGNAFTYNTYRQNTNAMLRLPPKDEAAEKMRPYIKDNVALMDQYDHLHKISTSLGNVLKKAPPTIWLVLTEDWCGDAAFNIPLMAIIENTFPEKVKLRLLLRDNNLELMDANLTDGGRSIPKLIVLDESFKELGHWGPRPAVLHTMIKIWKGEGLTLNELIPKIKQWYDENNTRALQEELKTLVTTYTAKIKRL
jgi:hypothetical protein